MTATYRNPVAVNGDFADPFVLRHDGRYYLYCTNPDLRCWTSVDLVSWTLCGPTIDEDEFPGLVPFAPEVVYADGWFFMYTSPSGQGHRALRSSSPTGPFRSVTGNLGHDIDGNVFIDDDDRWYFYWAGNEGIWGCEMASPTELGEPVLTGVHMNGWTEGPFVSKHDGRYYMTLTGNHYLSPGYRIDAASSAHPLTGYRADPLNPIVISTADGFLGLGHSSSVTGPDLVSTYMIYHNMNPDRSRDLDIDRQVWNGHSLQLLGPTSSAPAPARPDHRCDWAPRDVEGWVTRAGDLADIDGCGQLTGDDAHAVWQAAQLGEAFTAEINLTPSRAVAAYGLSLTGPQDTDGLMLLVDREEHTLAIRQADTVIAKEALVTRPLVRTFVHDALHCWRLVVSGGQLRLFLDGRLQAEVPAPVAPSCAVGVATSGGQLRIGSCALTRDVAEQADRSAPKPVPGRFWAALSLEAGTVTPATTAATFESVRLGPAMSATYDLNVQQPGRYTVALSGEFAVGDVLAIDVDGHEQDRAHVEHPGHAVSAELQLNASRQTLGIRCLHGRPVVSLVTTFAPAAPKSATTSGALSGFGKAVLTGPWEDGTVSATLSLRLDAPDAHGDLIFRASQLAEGGEGDDTRLGIDFLLGYSVQLHRDRVVLARHDYDEKILAAAELPIDDAVPHDVTVRARGSIITVDIDGEPRIHVDDVLPHLVGQVGIRTAGADLRAQMLHVTADGQ
ncbi:MAG: glycoside hydrolase family 43 protein [Cellulomonas sp.]